MKAFFFDIDGTLIDGRNGLPEIPHTVMIQLERLHEAGHKLVICTGRSRAMVDARFRLPIFDAYIMCNGAHVEVDGEALLVKYMDRQLTQNYAQLFDELGIEYMLQTAHHVYIDRRFTLIPEFFAGFGNGDIFTYEFDQDEAIGRTIKLEAHATPETFQRMRDAVEGKAAYTARMDGEGSYHSFEVYSPTASKAVGMELLLDHFGIRKEDSYAFGDGINDLEMVEFAGTGVAMGNACDELKAVADAVCGLVTEDGLARYLAGVS